MATSLKATSLDSAVRLRLPDGITERDVLGVVNRILERAYDPSTGTFRNTPLGSLVRGKLGSRRGNISVGGSLLNTLRSSGFLPDRDKNILSRVYDQPRRWLSDKRFKDWFLEQNPTAKWRPNDWHWVQTVDSYMQGLYEKEFPQAQRPGGGGGAGGGNQGGGANPFPNGLTKQSFLRSVRGMDPNAASLRQWWQQNRQYLEPMGWSFLDHANNPKLRSPNGQVFDVIEGGSRGGIRWQWLLRNGAGGSSGGFGGSGSGGGYPFEQYLPPEFSYPDFKAPGSARFSYPDFEGVDNARYETFSYPEFPEWTPPTAEEVAAEPGYQLGLTEGLGALENIAASRGMLLHPNAYRELTEYATDYAGTYYPQAFNRMLGAYQTNLGAHQANFGNQFGIHQANQGTLDRQYNDVLREYLMGYTQTLGEADRAYQHALDAYLTNRDTAALGQGFATDSARLGLSGYQGYVDDLLGLYGTVASTLPTYTPTSVMPSYPSAYPTASPSFSSAPAAVAPQRMSQGTASPTMAPTSRANRSVYTDPYAIYGDAGWYR